MREKHRQLLHKCAQFAMKSYENFDDNNVDKVSNVTTDTKVYLILENDTVYITGPGSESYTDWMLDFQIWRTKVSYFNNSLVHAGFMKIYESIKDLLHQKLVATFSLNNNIQNIVCTGHSLFGAVSTIIAADCANKYDDKHISCVTFGSPRVGNVNFAKFFNSNVDVSFRCVFAKDPITFSPVPLRFKHVHGSVYCDEKSAKVVDDAKMAKWNLCGCRIAHHSMSSYLASLSVEILPLSSTHNRL